MVMASFGRCCGTDLLPNAALCANPLIDAVSCAIDYRAVPDGSERRVTAFNGIVSTLTAIAVGVAGVVGGEGAILGVFGAWAIVSGAAQLAVGIYRRGPVLGKQWPTLISGGLSFLVGAVYIAKATGPAPALDVLSVYATGGGVFFVVQALLLIRKS
ncbi:DUF308 domain-containing protein [Nocardia macrotermitis]|uniref:Transmembrane protein n=1 Tax=Nocardia macrotermitis TaxID=2585198 RepID=A0A7K0DA33_9NOCA|nr:DUF308 domain-containing protein [Nocardia macrotermitis]MQY22630.1 hypothetical protein [Nocardia macrotermitis]